MPQTSPMLWTLLLIYSVSFMYPHLTLNNKSSLDKPSKYNTNFPKMNKKW